MSQVEKEIRGLETEKVDATVALRLTNTIENEKNETPHLSIRKQILATAIIITSAALGIGTGVILSNIEAHPDVVSWVGLPGNLFIRSLTCTVLPMIFVNIILAVVQMMEAGKAGVVGKYTILLYLLTTVIASLVGLTFVALFKDQFARRVSEQTETFIILECPENLGFVSVTLDGSLSCSDEVTNSSQIQIVDPNEYLVKAETGVIDTYTFSATLQDGIFRKLVPSNIVEEFANGAFLGVVMFGVVFGIASQSLSKKPKLLIEFLDDVNDILTKIITWIIFLTPIAVFSLISSTLGGQEDLETTLNDVRVLLLASLSAFATYWTIVYPGIFFLVTRSNPYSYLRYVIPAQIFAFSSSSSAATLPVTLRCVTETGLVPNSIRDFVLPIGATINMDGTGLYFPPTLVYLAIAGGLEEQLDFATYFLIIVVGTLGTAGSAPVPSASLVTAITAFNTVFNTTGTPQNFGIIIGIDFLMARIQTLTNITGDTLVARMVTVLTRSDVANENISEVEASKGFLVISN
eukprot:maker-scaffold_49-snap-gene-1.88-mRNA-1 protein AED:0.04 eAED:0.04 QI:0/0/0/0.66/1/1/3/0/520